MKTLLSSSSIAIPAILAVLAPLSVLFGLQVLHSVWWTFLLYHVVFCLVFPALESHGRGLNWPKHADLMGLRGGIPYTAAIWGVITALITFCVLLLLRDALIPLKQIEITLVAWSVQPEQSAQMLLLMVLLNAPAEELFWRGYLPGRVALAYPKIKFVRPTVLVISALMYTSYHAATVGQLVDHKVGPVAMVTGILGAGLFWGWLRWRTGSIWAPLLSHLGAVMAYTLFHVAM